MDLNTNNPNPLEQGAAGDHDAVGVIRVQLHARLLSWAIMDLSISAQTVERFSDTDYFCG